MTANPTAEWTAQQLLEAFPWDSAPRYLLHDRDKTYGEKFQEATTWLGIREVLTAPQSPWQNAYAERLIGSIRRECLDHLIVGLCARIWRGVTEKHDEALREMVDQIRGNLLAAEVMIGLKKLELPGVDFGAAKQMATSAREAIERGQLGYALITAAKT